MSLSKEMEQNYRNRVSSALGFLSALAVAFLAAYGVYYFLSRFGE
jgi:hypothetical protein